MSLSVFDHNPELQQQTIFFHKSTGHERRDALFSQATRAPVTGAFVGQSFNIPAGATGMLEVRLDLDPVEMLDTSRVLWIHLYEFVSSQWRHVRGIQWTGGANSDPEFGDNFNPRMWFDVARVAGKQVRIQIDDPGGDQIGYTVKVKT